MSTPATDPRMPAEDESAVSEKKIRQLFKREFAQRSLSVKKELASTLLQRSYDKNTPAMRFAMLKLGMEVADGGRAYGTGCEIGLRWHSLFGVNSVEHVVKLVDGFKVRNTSSLALASLGEGMFRESLQATKTNQFVAADKLIRVANMIAKKGPYATVTRRAMELLESLPTDSDQDDPQGSSVQLDDKQQLARDELVSLLEQYQFQPILRDQNAVRFVRSTGADPDAGRDLWEFNGPTITMKSPENTFATGIIDPAFNSDAFVLRLQVKADSSNATLLIGVQGSGELTGYQIPLAGRTEYSVNQTATPQLVAKPTGRIARNKSGWDHVEVVLLGEQLMVSVNGNRVTDARIKPGTRGTVGLLVDLRRGVGHQLAIRNVRLMNTVAAE